MSAEPGRRPEPAARARALRQMASAMFAAARALHTLANSLEAPERPGFARGGPAAPLARRSYRTALRALRRLRRHLARLRNEGPGLDGALGYPPARRSPPRRRPPPSSGPA